MKICKSKKCATQKVVVKKEAPKAPKAPKAAAKKTVTFTVHADKGKSVYLAGEFNDWDPSAKKMAYSAKNGTYTATLKLAAGSYQYKFVIDGTWCADPENVNAIANDQGTFNSIVTVKQDRAQGEKRRAFTDAPLFSFGEKPRQKRNKCGVGTQDARTERNQAEAVLH